MLIFDRKPAWIERVASIEPWVRIPFLIIKYIRDNFQTKSPGIGLMDEVKNRKRCDITCNSGILNTNRLKKET